MPAKSGWKSVTWPEEVDSAGLPVVLSHNAAVRLLRRIEPRPGLGDIRDHLLPAKLVSIMLRKNSCHMAVFAPRNLERKLIHVDNKLIYWKDRNNDRSDPGTAQKQNDHDQRPQPGLTRFFNPIVESYRPGRQEHRIDGREIVRLSLEYDEYG